MILLCFALALNIILLGIGEDALWLKQIHFERPNIANKLLLTNMRFYHKHYLHQGDTAISRCLEAAAARIYTHRSVPDKMKDAFRRESARALVKEIAHEKDDKDWTAKDSAYQNPLALNAAHEQMLRDFAEDEGEDEELAEAYSREFNDEEFVSDSKEPSLADAYVSIRRQSIQEFDPDETGAAQNDEPRQQRRRMSKYESLVRVGGQRLLHTLKEDSIRRFSQAPAGENLAHVLSAVGEEESDDDASLSEYSA